MSDMADTNGSTVKEMVKGLSDRIDAYAMTQAQQNAALQAQITDLRINVEVHKAGDGHENLSKSLAAITASLDEIKETMAEERGEKSGAARTWKLIAAVASLPGIGAAVAMLTGNLKAVP